MGVRITPCFRCPLSDGCEQREVFRRRAKSMGAVSVRFRCARLSGALITGARIVIRNPFTDDDGSDNFQRVYYENVSATIMSTDGLRFSCLVDDDERFEDRRFRFRKKQAAYRIVRFLDDPKSEICRCGNVIDNGFCQTLAGPIAISACELGRDA